MAYRQMLAKLSAKIRRDELETMKFLCIDLIPRALLEDIETCIQLWVALEERDALSETNTGFLESMLTNACGSRQDVLQILETYTNSSQAEQLEDLQKEFDWLTENVGREWRPLARKLRLTEGEIDNITQKHDRHLQEQIRACLNLWQKKHADTATKVLLTEALKACKKNMLAYEIANLS